MDQPIPLSQMSEGDASKLVSEIIERRDESKKFAKDNHWLELQEVWRAIKCRTKPIYKRDPAGLPTKEEDKSRTNVAMPDLNIIYRKNAARMTAQPYRLNYRGGTDPSVPERLSSLAMQQYARSGEPPQDLRCVMAAEAFGYGYTKIYEDKLTIQRNFRRAIIKNGQVVPLERSWVMKSKGASEQDIQQAVAAQGQTLNNDEMAAFAQKSGKEVSLPFEIKKYEGPITKWVFNGDLFLEPGTLTLEASSYVSEQYRETDLWLKKRLDLTYEDADGNDVPAFDEKAVNELLNGEGDVEIRREELRDMFNASVGLQTEQSYRFPKNLKIRKKFDIVEEHCQGDDGRLWITWVSEKYKDRPLGRMPYPWDFYGKYAYTEYVPLPDLICCYGDATPRLLRFLYAMHNATVAQNFDYISNMMKKFLLTKQGLEIGNDVIDRGFFRQLEVQSTDQIKYLQEPPLPSGAFERESQVLRMMGVAEPSLNTVDTGTASNPMAGKLATTAILGAKAADALTQFKLDGRNMYLREHGMKKLWINQAAQEEWQIQQEHFSEGLAKTVQDLPPENDPNRPEWAMSDRYGKTVAVKLNPIEIQEDLNVEPEAGSYLAVDDEIRQQAAMQLQQAASAAPDIYDRRKVARFVASTIRGIGNPDDYILPEPQGPPPLVPKVGVNVTYKGENLPAELTNELLGLAGLQPSEELVHRDTLDAVNRLSDAADSAANLASDQNPPEPDISASGKPVTKPKPKPSSQGGAKAKP